MIYSKGDTHIIPLDIESFKEDEHLYAAMFNNSNTTKLTSNGRFAYDSNITRANIDSVNCILWSVHRHMVADQRHIPIGLVALQRINLIDRSAELAVILGNHRGVGHGYRASWMALDHGFRRIGLHRIWTGTSALNIAMRKTAVKLNMENEGIYREAMMIEGMLVDIYAFAVLAPQWQANNQDFSKTKVIAAKLEEDHH